MNINGYEIKSTIPEADLDTFATAAAYCGLSVDAYSGRGMYGNETVSARYEYSDELAALKAELPKKLRSRVRTDNMGRSFVAYLA